MVVARVATPVREVCTQSVHSLMAAFALLTPGDCFLTVFDRMGSFFHDRRKEELQVRDSDNSECH